MQQLLLLFQFRAKQKVINQTSADDVTKYLSSACFRQLYIGRRLSDRLIRKSWTAYTTDECQQFCAKEKDFRCRGFAYRLKQQQQQQRQLCFRNSN
jgi:hypothetical protein